MELDWTQDFYMNVRVHHVKLSGKNETAIGEMPNGFKRIGIVIRGKETRLDDHMTLDAAKALVEEKLAGVSA